jgi:hypothetical protein
MFLVLNLKKKKNYRATLHSGGNYEEKKFVVA